jgi:hypothetical protein
MDQKRNSKELLDFQTTYQLRNMVIWFLKRNHFNSLKGGVTMGATTLKITKGRSEREFKIAKDIFPMGKERPIKTVIGYLHEELNIRTAAIDAATKYIGHLTPSKSGSSLAIGMALLVGIMAGMILMHFAFPLF